MKRWMLVLLSVALILSLTACKSENMKNAESLVAAIGEVTLESGDAIAAAEEAMALLTDKERDKFAENEGILIVARATYDGLRVGEVIEAIAQFDGDLEYSYAMEESLASARALYESLSDTYRKQVTNLAVLMAAEEGYAAYCAEVTGVEEMISGIGEVTLATESAVASVRDAFEELNEEQQEAVGNAADLAAAEEAIAAEKAEAAEVDALIAAIGNVTMDSGEAIAAAWDAYDALDAEQQAAVQNFLALAIADETYAGYVAEIGMVEGMISSIGEVTQDSTGAVDAARAAYDAMSDELKAYVTNVDVLAAAEEALVAVKAVEIEAMIDAIGEVTLDSEAAIAAARAAYDGVAPEVAALVGNLEKLEAAEAAYEIAVQEAEAAYALSLEEAFLAAMAEVWNQLGAAVPESADTVLATVQKYVGKMVLGLDQYIDAAKSAFDAMRPASQESLAVYLEALTTLETAYDDWYAAEKQKMIDALMKKMRTEEDRVQGYTWISSKTEPQYSDDRCFLLPYIGKSNAYGNYWLIIRYNYTYDSWVFFEEITIVTDTNKYSFTVDYFDVMRDNDYGVVWEVYDDTAVSAADIAMLRDIASSSEVIVRFEGDEYYWDFTVPAKDKTAITEVVDLFEALTGK